MLHFVLFFFFSFQTRFSAATSTRNVEAFLEKTAIAYRQNVAFFLEFGWHAIAVFSKNATTLRVLEHGDIATVPWDINRVSPI